MARFARPPAGVPRRSIATARPASWSFPADHPRAGSTEVALADLRSEPMVAFPEAYGSALRRMFVEQCQAAGFAPTFVQESPDTWTSVALVAAGVGLHFTADTAVVHMPLDRSPRRPARRTDGLPLYVFLLWRRGDDDPALAHVLTTAEELFPTVAPDGRAGA